jgi:hypothetical protein
MYLLSQRVAYPMMPDAYFLWCLSTVTSTAAQLK